MDFTFVCPSLRQFVRSSHFRISSHITKSTIKSSLVCTKSEKYAFLVTLRPQSDRCRQGEAEVHILDFKTTRSEIQKASQTATEQGKAE